MKRNEKGQFEKGHKPWNTGIQSGTPKSAFKKGNVPWNKGKGKLKLISKWGKRGDWSRKEIAWSINENGCWICTSHKPNTYGYPQRRCDGKFRMISHIMYEKYIGEIPKGMLICHTCDNPICINPSHLFVGTSQDNTNDKVKKNRQSHVGSPGLHGEKHPQAKLTEEIVRKILNYKGMSHKEISDLFKIPYNRVWSIRNRKSWTHIKES
jgi:hypothetical protein